MKPVNRSYQALIKRLTGVENGDVQSIDEKASPVFDIGRPAPVIWHQYLSQVNVAFNVAVLDFAVTNNQYAEILQIGDFDSMKLTNLTVRLTNNSAGPDPYEFRLQLFHEVTFNITKIIHALPLVDTGVVNGTHQQVYGEENGFQPIVLPTGPQLAAVTNPLQRKYIRFRIQVDETAGFGAYDWDIFAVAAWELVPKSGKPFPAQKYRFIEGTDPDY